MKRCFLYSIHAVCLSYISCLDTCVIACSLGMVSRFFTNVMLTLKADLLTLCSYGRVMFSERFGAALKISPFLLWTPSKYVWGVM
jgi:hypothetical protein